jgi:TolB-like protein
MDEVDSRLCSRITDAFIDSLALVEGVRRSPRKSGWRWLDENELCRSLAQTNDMHHVLTGRIGSSNDTLSLTLRLYKRRSDQPLWNESLSGKANELIVLEGRALREIAARLGLRLSTNENARIATLLTNNSEAFRWYQQARAVYTREAGTQIGYEEVRKLAQKARGLDPRYLDADYWDAYMLRNLAQDRAPSGVWPDLERRMRSLLEQDDTYDAAIDHFGGLPALPAARLG